MTTSQSVGSATIGQLRDEFARAEGSKLAADDASRLRKFVTWCGISTAASAIQPYKVEEFLQLQQKTSVPPRLYMPVLKAFFSYATKNGLIESDPMKVARLPRGAGAAKKTAPTGPSAAAQAAAAARQAQKQEEDVLYVSRERL